ncbi:hypothetical protein F5141DRAFT_1124778 [Pisolithus sp. B1]|nr:hypothetical protein F5141DRAFT_1124778 [Pisolithus sp. B1]
MPSPPLLGSLAVQAPSLAPQLVYVSPATCHNLSLFKDLLREYRRLDDTITMRLNQLVENWKRRTEIVDYCVDVVDQSMNEKRRVLEGQHGDARAQRKAQADLFAEEVKRNQVHNELSVERIIRNRSLDGRSHCQPYLPPLVHAFYMHSTAFQSRCRYFTPPMNDVEARKWWNAAQSQEAP